MQTRNGQMELRRTNEEASTGRLLNIMICTLGYLPVAYSVAGCDRVAPVRILIKKWAASA